MRSANAPARETVNAPPRRTRRTRREGLHTIDPPCPPRPQWWRVLSVSIAAAIVCLTTLRAADDAKRLDTRALTSEIDRFLLREVTAHFAAISTLEPPPGRVLGARTAGEFSWGTFMRALAAIADHAKTLTLAERDVPQWIGRMGLIEARAGSKAFSQMYAALALQHFGENLEANPVWQR